MARGSHSSPQKTTRGKRHKSKLKISRLIKNNNAILNKLKNN
jgi:hypothetical protein